ncbi:MAG: hypothetical protein CM1200mP16_16100 [Nitrospina sp.]|nr:MAG: hypothetical protein CM1200mP16_16100 [Nitrospina sp.]
MDDEAIFFLSKCLYLNRLESLNISSNKLSPLGAKVLSMAGGLSNLKCLDLSYNRLEGLGLKSLVESSLCQQFFELNLRDTGIGMRV